MATNLWRDVDALMRLAASTRALEESIGAGAVGADAAGGLLPATDAGRFAIASAGLAARVVSGDLVDAFMLPDGTLAFAIGDVSGKGVPAGMLRACARPILRHVAPLSGSPGETLARVNRILYDVRLDAMFVSLFLGRLDLATGRLRYASAGHPTPFRLRPGGAVDAACPATGPILGILDVRSFATESIDLEPGETLVLYTDGVVEAQRPRGRALGEVPIADLLGRRARSSPASICRAVLRAVEAHQRGRRHDDATLLAVRFKGGRARRVRG
jgi:sigma-B regulation protein RsbU (phosphoserine phosphatase)